MSTEHYFSASPSSDEAPVLREVTLRGNPYSVVTQGGVFSHDRVDKGTAVLLSKVPDPLLAHRGIAVDVGCGWGPITLALAAAAPGAHVWGVDVNERARKLTAENLERAGLSGSVFSPEEAFAQLGDRKVDLIWSNPPVRIGKAELHSLLSTWLTVLSDDGVAYLVVQKNLGADSLQNWLHKQGFGCEKIGSAKGFRVFEATRHPRADVVDSHEG
ncbi:class I SAM-dependent methyltransferase [Changpingibacter yushuensis]|uniref:class I SAM-dependent methyltransferase n=1 Tax=Changpingibacter yushuensis TaxID=2758440 RepID=UPI0015F6B8C1|nr:methyltransferase [Changpingibacter yushuensis]